MSFKKGEKGKDVCFHFIWVQDNIAEDKFLKSRINSQGDQHKTINSTK